MKQTRFWLIMIAVLLCSVTQSYATTQTFDDWTSTNQTHSSVSSNTYAITTEGNTILSFDWKTSCEVGFDEMIVTLDGNTVLRKSGENSGTYTQELNEGEHTLVVKYTKDEAGSEGEDLCKISNIKILPNPVVSSGFSKFEDWASTNKSHDSTSSHTYTFTTTGNAVLNFDWFVSSEPNYDKLIVVLNGKTILTESGEGLGIHGVELNSGEHTLYVRYEKDDEDHGGSNCAKITNVIVRAIEVPGILTFDDWISTNWSDKSTSSKKYTFSISGNAVLSFDWLVSSESADIFTVILDGTTILSKGGEYDGSQTHTLGSGAHTLVAKYTKDSSDDGGEDCGKIFNIAVESVLAAGTCGENLIWKLYPNEDLVIMGDGAMADYTSSTIPWIDYIESIKTVTIEEGVTSIGNSAFYGHKINSIRFSESVVSIGDYAFRNCSNLTGIMLPESINSIGVQAFHSCVSLTSFDFPQNVTVIKSGLLGSCTGITSINIPEGVTSIEEAAFINCTGLSSITIPNSVTNFGRRIFQNCTGEVTINCNISNKSSETYGVFWAADFSKAIIGDKVTSIGSYAFHQCENLTGIEISESVNEIGRYAFKGCVNLTAVTIPEGVKSIQSSTFEECSSLQIITIPQSVTSIGAYAFNDCTNLTAITLPENVTSIGQSAFSYCESLINVVIPEGVTNINWSTFAGCKKLESVSIPSTVTSIGWHAFEYCTSLFSITIPENVTTIDMGAFHGCKSLTSIFIPQNVTNIGSGVISDCNKLTSIVVDERNLIYDSRDNRNAIIETNTNTLIAGCASTIIPNSITSIGDKAFYWCSELTEITIPENVNSIGEYAFAYCNKLTAISIPENVNSIGEYAFAYCNKLTAISIPENVTNIGTSAFYRYSFASDEVTNVTLYSNRSVNSSDFPSKVAFHLVLNDSKSSDLDVSIGNIYESITYNRELAAGKYGTIILPFAPDEESLKSFVFFELTAVDDETLTFDEVEVPQANTPYLYRLRAGKSATQITGGETTISSTIVSPKLSGWKTVGSFTNQTVDCSGGEAYYYAVNAEDNMLYNVTSKLNVKPFRAYFKGTTKSTSQLAIRTRGGEVTRIDATEVEDLAPAIYYDLNGRRVENPEKGIYIVNGKKVIL